MGISEFLASVAANFKQHYLNLALTTENSRTPEYYTSSRIAPLDNSEITPPEPTDSYEPSGAAIADPDSVTAPDSKEPVESNPTPTGTSPVERKPDGTYYYQRRAQLDYQLNLRFDLGAVTSTVERLADGESKALEESAAAGFGFQAGFDLKGSQVVKTNMDEIGHSNHQKALSVGHFRNAGTLAYQDRSFALQSFYKEAAKVRRSLDESVQGNHRRTVNRIALRFRLDNRFSVAFANRFNVQTGQVADRFPQAVAGYVGSAGEVAAKGSTDLMATFFDAVDGYLQETEQNLLDRVSQFFEQAAAELGFSEALVEQAQEHLVGTIESFFDRVDQAVQNLETRFMPEAPEPIAEPPEITAPQPILEDLYNPATVEDKYMLATA